MGLRDAPRVVESDGTVSIVKIVSLSPRVEKPKSQEGNKSFVPELPRVVKCLAYFHVSGNATFAQPMKRPHGRV